MKRILLASVAVVAVVGVAVAAGEATSSAHPGARPEGHRMMGMHHHRGAMHGAMLARYDANGDGSITRSEIDAGLTKDFKSADTDRNNKLSSAELKAFMEARHAEMKAKMGMPDEPGDKAKNDGEPGKDGAKSAEHNMDPVKHLDWNLDGSLSFEEVSAPVRLLAMQLDHDASGTITATDLLGLRGGPMMGGL
jgi:hypothetical protein